MLVHPYPFTEEIKKLYATNIFPKQEGYKYLFLNGYFEYPDITDSEYNSVQRISVNDLGEILGYMTAGINRESWTVTGIAIMSFNLSHRCNKTLMQDIVKFFDDLFTLYKFKKIEIAYCEQNPGSKMYQKFMQRYNGKVTGKGVGSLYNREQVEVVHVEFSGKEGRL